ncbi:hypothetical protein MKW92_048504 [Papaver armeniacum]|nr:hypothetical protein MKW92_048504 [Papaver armeniacum]
MKVSQEMDLNMVGMRCNKRVGRRCFVLKASSSGYQKVDKINGRKVNDMYIERTYDRAQESNSWDGAPVHEHLFVIRSYEIGTDKTAYNGNSHESALYMETALNHVMSSGLAGNGFGATHDMSLRKLIWVVTRIHIQGDVVEVNTWVDAAGKNGMRREWEIRDNKTQHTWVVMNRETIRLSKMPNNLTLPQLNSLSMYKITALDGATCMPINKVNNVKYIGWILESIPINVLEDYNLTSMTLEFRRECRQSNFLESLTHMEVIEAEEITNSESKTKADFRSTHS